MKKLVWLLLTPYLLSSCAYRMGYSYQELPRDMKSLHVPMFNNSTQDVGPEVDFTNSLVEKLKRSQVAKVLGKDQADGILEGRIISIARLQRDHDSNDDPDTEKTTGLVNLPFGTYVATEFLLVVKVELLLKDRKTKKTVWKQWFEDQASYFPARLALAGINTSAPNYTKSEEQRVLKDLAGVMMEEAIGRLTENF